MSLEIFGAFYFIACFGFDNLGKKIALHMSNTAGTESIEAVNFKKIAEAIKILQNNFKDQLSIKLLD